MNKKTGFMCRTDYEHELENASGGVEVYSSVNDLKKHKSCWQDCGIVEVEIIEKNKLEEKMDAELEQKLFDKYPDLFQNRHKPIQETCMAWGLEFGTGWYDIMDNVCFQITEHEKNVTNEKGPRYNKDYQPVRFEQTKQKFGGLRIYYDGGDEYVRGVIHMAEAMSYCVCEECGDKGKPNKGGWISTLCENCTKGLNRLN